MTDAYAGQDRRRNADSLPSLQNPWVLPGFAVLVEVIFFVALVMSFLGEDKTLLNVMCTAAIAQAGIVANFFFGSSAGSARKDDALAATSVKQNETIAAQGAALAASAPVTTTTTIDPGPPPTATTTTAPAESAPKPPAENV